jgi:hypothetical protein
MADEEPTMKQVIAGIQYLAQQMRIFEAREAARDAQYKTLESHIASPPPTKSTSEPAVPTNVDLDAMTNKELATYLSTQIKEGLVKPITDRLAITEDRITRSDVKNQLDSVSGKDPNFWEYQEEIKTLVRENPELSISRALAIAKAEAPEKTSTLAAKAAEVVAAEVAKRNSEKASEFGGLLPTSMRPSKSASMDATAASEDAWQEVMGGTPYDREATVG